jgi:hypothetical protein
LNALARRTRLSRSDIVREALAQYEARNDTESPGRPYDQWLDVIGVVDLGARDPRRTTGEQFADALRNRSAPSERSESRGTRGRSR